MGDDFGPLLPGEGWLLFVMMLVAWLVLIAAVVGATVLGVLAYRRNRTRSQTPPLPAAPQASLGSRLTEIDDLLAAGSIDDEEHAAMRSRLLDLQ